MNKQHIKRNNMPSEARQKKIMEKLNRAQKCSILGPQNLGSRGARAPGPPGSAPHCTISRDQNGKTRKFFLSDPFRVRHNTITTQLHITLNLWLTPTLFAVVSLSFFLSRGKMQSLPHQLHFFLTLK